ncbi:MAG: hypothetical protein DI527_02355 [Chelatococcus sp.]|nr:MAG: hypothetical protein DI527_02355 [Chelatococcus sp.]
MPRPDGPGPGSAELMRVNADGPHCPRLGHDADQANGLPMNADTEIELKLAVPETAWPELAGAVLRAGGRHAGPSRALRSIYFDTQDGRLRRNGFVLRIRSDGEAHVQTIKSGAGRHSMIGRGEWQTPIHGNTPVAVAGPNAPLAKVLRAKDIDKLRPAFTVDVERDTYMFTQGETVVEIVLDKGVVRHLYTQESFSEVEFELKQGSRQDLFALVREVGAAVPAVPSLTTKAERGYRIELGTSGRPITRVDYAPTRDMDAAAIARALVRPCLAALFDNLAMLMAGGTSEVLHQARVCVRRLRASLTLLGAALGWRGGEAVRGELKWLSDCLGQAREYDVFVKSALARAEAAHPDAPGFEALRAAFRRRQDEAAAGVGQALRSPRLLGLNLDMLARFDTLAPGDFEPGKTAGAGGEAAWRRLEKELRRRLKSLVRDADALEELSAEKQHGIRIRAKKLRYMLEPFADLVPPRRFRAIVAALQAIQDELGDINDDRVNCALALAHARAHAGPPQADDDPAPASLFAAGLIVAICRERRPGGNQAVAAARRKLLRSPALAFG